MSQVKVKKVWCMEEGRGLKTSPTGTITSLTTSKMSTISSRCRWTDDDLLCVLVYTNGDLTVALETIKRHDATGRPPEELIQMLSAGEQYVAVSSSPHRQRFSRSESKTEMIQSQSIPNDSDRVDLGGCSSDSVALDAISREGGVVAPSLARSISAPPTSSLEGGGSAFDLQLEGQPINRNVLTNNGMFCEGPQAGTIPAASPSSTADTMNHSTPQTQQRIDMNRTLTLTESIRRHIDEEAEVSELESKHQRMLNMQSGIEASLKETRNTSETSTDIDDEFMSYAAKVSKETFDEEYRKQEVRNELEKRMVNISLAASLSDPVQKSEEELIGEALKKSLADPIPKSEEQLIKEARRNSLEDLERLGAIMKSEEELVEAAKQKSLHMMSEDEELIEDVKRQSLISVSSSVGKKPAPAYWRSNSYQRQSTSTSTTYPLPLGSSVDDSSECSSSLEVEHLAPSIDDSSSVNMFNMDLMDRKMPALALPVAQECDNDVNNSPSLINPRTNPRNVASTDADALSSSSSDQTKKYDNRSGSNTEM